MRFPAKKTSSCIWVAIPVDCVILLWYTCGADGRSFWGEPTGRCTVTWLPNFLGWVDLLTYGAPLARESSAKNGQLFWVFKVQTYLYEKGSTVMRARSPYPLAWASDARLHFRLLKVLICRHKSPFFPRLAINFRGPLSAVSLSKRLLPDRFIGIAVLD